MKQNGQRLITALTLLVIALPFSAYTQQINVNADVDSNSIVIGSPFNYHLEVKHGKNTVVQWPEIIDTLGAFEILNKKAVDTGKKSGKIIKKQEIELTSFKPGKQHVPSLVIAYREKGDTAIQHFYTDSFPVNVNTLPVDTAKSIKPIKGIMDVPVTFWEVFPYIAIGLGIIVLIMIAILLYKKLRLKETPEPFPKPERPAHEIALEKLQNLKSKGLWQQGNIKDYHDQLTDIVREYLERAFRIHALELTTGEIMDQLAEKPLSDEQKKKLKQIFESADLAKFAKADLSPEENEEAMKIAFDIIEATKPTEQAESEETASSDQ